MCGKRKGGCEVLEIENLTVSAEGEEILKDISLDIPGGQIHILLGPNGSGKTTLLRTIMGLGNLRVEKGRIIFKGQDITHMPVDQRARLGIGIAMQKAPVIPELTLGELTNMMGEKHGGTRNASQYSQQLNCDYLQNRPFNENFSGGEMKRGELLQLLIQDPSLILVDEPESGVDLDNISVVGEALRNLLKARREVEKERSGLVITHTGNIMDYLNADRGYVMLKGRILCSGNPRDLFEEVEKHGYEGCKECQKILQKQ